MPQLPIKITQLTKDFNIKSKDVLDTFASLGIEKKSGGSVDTDEFEIFMERMMKTHEIKDLDAYRDGKTKIVSMESKPRAEKPEVKVPEVKAEAPKAAPVSKKEPAPAPMAAPERKPAPAERPAAPAPERRPQQDRPEMRQRPADRPTQQQSDRTARPAQQGQRDGRPAQQGQQRDNRGYQKYNAAPQENPFARKIDNMNRTAQGFKPIGSQPDRTRKPEPAPMQKPVQKPVEKPAAPVSQNTARPAQQAMLDKQQKLNQQKVAPKV